MYSGKLPRKLGLIIGVSQYQDSAFQSLHYAENDARALAQWFVNTKGGKWSPPDVQLVQGQHATRELVEAVMTQICINKAEADDIICLYFAGQAFVDEKSGAGYLALANTRYQDPTTALALTTFTQQVLARTPARQMVCILDCFQTGSAWSRQRSNAYDMAPLLGPAVLNALPHMPNRQFLCSCRGNEGAPEAGERGLGLFMHRMIVGLCGPAGDSSTDTITLPRLSAYLAQNLGVQQQPQIFGQQQSPMILVGTTAPAVEQVQAPTNNKTMFAQPGVPRATEPLINGRAKIQDTPYATVATQTPLPSQEPSTSGYMLSSALDQQRQQRLQETLAQAQQLLQAQNYAEAFNLVEQILQVVPNESAALTLKAQLLGAAGRFQEALTVVDQLSQLNPNNALAWSMRAVALGNLGQYEPALSAIEHALELDAQNPENHTIKNTIMANMAAAQQQAGIQTPNPLLNTTKEAKRGGPVSFLIGIGLQIAGLFIGTAGAVLTWFQTLPSWTGLVLVSIGLALLCVNAARGAFRHGISRVFVTLVVCLIAGGILGAAYKLGYTRLLAALQNKNNAGLLVPIMLIVVWLAVAATVPMLPAIGGLISGLIARARTRRRSKSMA